MGSNGTAVPPDASPDIFDHGQGKPIDVHAELPARHQFQHFLEHLFEHLPRRHRASAAARDLQAALRSAAAAAAASAVARAPSLVPRLCGVDFSTQLVERAHEVHPAVKAQRDGSTHWCDGADRDVRRAQFEPQNERCRPGLNSWKHGLLLVLKPPRCHGLNRASGQPFRAGLSSLRPNAVAWLTNGSSAGPQGCSVSMRLSRPCLQDSQEL